MTRPTLWQSLFGIDDLTPLSLTEDKVIDIARNYAERNGDLLTNEVLVTANVHWGTFRWYLQFPGIWTGPATLIEVDDETGEVKRFHKRLY
ncbi:MAG: hypothetical protein ACR2QJ_01025 [Geminicoccaceae bacterium]